MGLSRPTHLNHHPSILSLKRAEFVFGLDVFVVVFVLPVVVRRRNDRPPDQTSSINVCNNYDLCSHNHQTTAYKTTIYAVTIIKVQCMRSQSMRHETVPKARSGSDRSPSDGRPLETIYQTTRTIQGRQYARHMHPRHAHHHPHHITPP